MEIIRANGRHDHFGGLKFRFLQSAPPLELQARKQGQSLNRCHCVIFSLSRPLSISFRDLIKAFLLAPALQMKIFNHDVSKRDGNILICDCATS
jgi:hypothetical protein